MHVKHPLRPRALVKIVDVLGDQQQLTGPFCVEPRQGHVRGIGFDRAEPRPARIVKGVDQGRVALESLGRGDILDAMSFPQSIGPAECRKATFRGDPCAGQDDDVPNVRHITSITLRV
jgi:hypothetical protein